MPGLSLLLLGVERTRASFPLPFLGLALPIPLAMTERSTSNSASWRPLATADVLPRVGVPVFAEGTTLHLPGGPIEVADACSGFSTLYAAVAVAC